MTTIRQIISSAYEESRLIPLGESPSAEELTKGLRHIKTVISSLFGNELGEELEDVSFGDVPTGQRADSEDYTRTITQTFIPSNTRLICKLTSTSTVYLPPNPRPGARVAVIDVSGNFATRNLTVNGNGRKIEAAGTLVLNTNSLVREWFYRDDLADWVRVSTLDENSSSPFPEEFDDLLITMLSMRLNPNFGKEAAPETIATYTRTRSRFRARYSQSKKMPIDRALRSDLYASEFTTGNI